MADKTISQLTTIESVAGGISNNDLMVLEHSGTAYSVSGSTLINYITAAADGHGGISTVAKTGTSGLVDTYTITYADGSTSTYTVTNGAKGNTGATGAASYVYIRYAAEEPNSGTTISSTPNDWMGIAVTTSSTAPTSYTAYQPWFKVVGDAATVESTPSVTYQVGADTGDMPTGAWVSIDQIGTISGGDYLWSKSVIEFNDGTDVTIYNKSRQGVDGTGTAGTSTPLVDSASGAAGTSTSFARQDHQHPYDVETIVVDADNAGTITSINYNHSAFSTMNRAYARRVGNMVILSFVGTLGSAISSSTTLFNIEAGYQPNQQVDFLMFANNSYGTIRGQVTVSSSTPRTCKINTIDALAASVGNVSTNVRGEVMWVIEE